MQTRKIETGSLYTFIYAMTSKKQYILLFSLVSSNRSEILYFAKRFKKQWYF